MCIIAIKCKGVDLPSEDTLRTMWTNNPHGAGIMYARDNRVYIDKGYMDWTSFYERLKSLGDVRDTALVMHFRIATHGSVIPGNTHPFPVSENVTFLTKLRLACKVGVAHNGIIPITPREGISDTMEYIASELVLIARKNAKWYMDKQTLASIGKRIQSKLAVLDGNGTVAYYGDFITESDGMLYSNTSYKPRTTALHLYTGDYYSRFEYDDGTTPPWDTGRKRVWLMPIEYTFAVAYDKVTYEPVDDHEDLWVDDIGNVYTIDYDTSVAYMLPNLEVSGASSRTRKRNKKFRLFGETDGISFEFGGVIPF